MRLPFRVPMTGMLGRFASAAGSRAIGSLRLLAPAAIGTSRLGRELEKTLGRLLRRGAETPAGRVHVIDVGAAVEELVERGGKSETTVRQAIQASIQRFLVRGDFFAQNDPTSYVVVFRELSPDDADVQCALIVREIGRRLFGQDEEGKIVARVAVTALDGGLDFEPLPTAERLVKRRGAARRHVASAVREGAPSTVSTQPVGRKRPAAPSWRLDAPPKNELLEALAAADAEQTVLEEGRAKDVREEIQEILPRVAREVRRDRDGADDERALAGEGCEVVTRYRPVWNASKSVIGTFAPNLFLKRGETEAPISWPSNDDADVLGLIDRVTLKRSVADLRTSLEGGRRHLTILPVANAALANSQLRQRYLKICAQVAEGLRAHIVWSIRATSNGLLDTQLLPAVATLRPYGRAVIVCGDLPPACFPQLAAMGVHGIGLNLAELPGDQREVLRKLDLLGAHATANRMQALAHNCHSLSVTAAAVCAGFAYLDGEAIAPLVETPADPFRFGLLDVYRPILGDSLAKPADFVA